MDRLGHYDQALVRALSAAGHRVGIVCQIGVLPTKSSDASAVHSVGATARTGVIGHPRHNSHGFEVAKLGVFRNIVETLATLLDSIDW